MESTEIFDVAVIGAGVVGCAIARELSGQSLRVVLVESRNDIGDATSKASTAILHTGFDASPGTLESRLVKRGYELWREFARHSRVAIEDTGALLVAWNEEQLATLPTLQEKAIANGYLFMRLVDSDTVYQTVPALGPGALGGLEVPHESVIDSWGAAVAFATDAVNRGTELRLESRVESVVIEHSHTVLHTARGPIAARWVVNAAGLGGDVIERMFGFERFHLHPRRGELFVFDKLSRPQVPVIVLPVPSKVGKGVLVSPTIYGNVMLGPTAEDMEDRADTSTTEQGFAFLLDKGRRLMPSLIDEEVTATYAGLRAASDQSDFVIEVDAATRYAVAGCIRSTGLTASPAIAEYLLGLLRDAGLACAPAADLPPPPVVAFLGECGTRAYQDEALIAADPAYGEIICFCERVTRGEIRDALTGVVPAKDVNGVRRRTRAQNGRCQGFYCGAQVQALIDEYGSGAS